jgi:hypothetical protein
MTGEFSIAHIPRLRFRTYASAGSLENHMMCLVPETGVDPRQNRPEGTFPEFFSRFEKLFKQRPDFWRKSEIWQASRRKPLADARMQVIAGDLGPDRPPAY